VVSAGHRGVRDVPWLDQGRVFFPDDLEEAERRQGVRVRPGDRYSCDWLWPRPAEGGEASVFTQDRLHASCLPWLHERGVALIGADTPRRFSRRGTTTC